jgi:hypothetical protein
MIRNLGTLDRLARLVAALPLFVCSVMAPLPLAARVAAFALPACYMILTALAGSCLGYRLMGRSTCPAQAR